MWEQIKVYWNQVPAWIRNRYFLVIAAFAIVILFLDTNNVFQLVNRTSKLRKLNKQEMNYQKEIAQLEEQKQAFDNNLEALEKFAREEYRMKRANEDIYVIVEKAPEPKDN